MTSSLPILYSFRRCPYAMRARMAMAVAGQDAWLREVVLRDKPAAMLRAGVRGTVPLLVFTDGRVIEESLDIMEWALRAHDPHAWLSTREGSTNAALLAANDDWFKDALDRYKYPQRFAKTSSSGVSARDQAATFVANLNLELAGRAFLGGDAIGFLDAAIFPFVRQFAAVEPTWFSALPYPHAIRWWQTMLEHPVFTSVMRKLAPWQEGDTPLRFLASLVGAE